MIEQAAKHLSKLVGRDFYVYKDEIFTSLTATEDWDAMFETLSKHCVLKEWNGAYIPGIEGIIDLSKHPDFEKSVVKVFPVNVNYCGSCCG